MPRREMKVGKHLPVEASLHPGRLAFSLTILSLALTLRTTRSNIQKFYVVLTCIYVFCTDLRTNSGYSLIPH